MAARAASQGDGRMDNRLGLLGGAPGKPARKRGAARAFTSVGQAITQVGRDFWQGDIWVKLSLLIWGVGNLRRRQYAKGIIMTLVQAALISLYPLLLWDYLSKFSTLGTVKQQMVFNFETMKNEPNDGDNSFKILLFGVIAMVLLIALIVMSISNMRTARKLQLLDESGKNVNSFSEDVRDYLNHKFHRTLLSVPAMGVLLFTVVPLIVIILTAFTNYDRQHMVPANLFTWVGITNFEALFKSSISVTFGYSFVRVLGWTLLWAVLATFTNYYAGILLALFINNKRTRLKKVWRTGFVVTIAIPQFVSLLLIRNFFANSGIVNTLCSDWGITDLLKQLGILSESYSTIPFLTHPSWAKVMIILINMWVGVPYMMLMSTGILMNIPSDLLESAQIDGANAFQRFRKITMPYIRFVTGAYLVSSIVTNINNFNIIYLLTDDIYKTQDQLLANSNAREVDLLVTWLYRLTQDYNNYKMASVIGIMIFIICAVFTLVAFTRLNRGDREERFQ